MIEPSAADSKEELGTVLKAYYQKPRRLGSVANSATLSGLSCVLDDWYGLIVRDFQDTSAIHIAAEEFPETAVNSNEQHGADTQLHDPESQHFENSSHKSSMVSILDLKRLIRMLPQCLKYDSRAQLACVLADRESCSDSGEYSMFDPSEGTGSLQKLTMPLEKKLNRIETVSLNKLRRRIKRARSRPEKREMTVILR